MSRKARLVQNSPGVMHATAAVTAFADGGLLVAHFDFSSLTASLVTLTAIWWAIEGLGLLAIGHRLTGWNAIHNRALALGLSLDELTIKAITLTVKERADRRPLSLGEVDALLLEAAVG